MDIFDRKDSNEKKTVFNSKKCFLIQRNCLLDIFDKNDSNEIASNKKVCF